MVVPQSLIGEVLRLCYEPGHFSFKRTIAKVADRFYWKNMGKHTLLYCRGCLTGQKRNVGIKHNIGLLQHFIAFKKNELIGIDVLSGVPRSRHGNEYILVITDY